MSQRNENRWLTVHSNRIQNNFYTLIWMNGLYYTFSAITILIMSFFIISASTMFRWCCSPHINTNCSTIHNQSRSLINNRMCHSSSKHALPFENPQLGQECKVDKSQAHQHILQWVQHRSYITKLNNQSDSKDKKRKVLQSNSSKRQ